MVLLLLRQVIGLLLQQISGLVVEVGEGLDLQFQLLYDLVVLLEAHVLGLEVDE